jgi:hypothetical protein
MFNKKKNFIPKNAWIKVKDLYESKLIHSKCPICDSLCLDLCIKCMECKYHNRWGLCACAWPRNRHYAHEHEPRFRHFCAPENAMRMNPKIFCFLAIYQLKFFYKQHNSTKLDKGYRLVYKLSCLITKKNSTVLDILQIIKKLPVNEQ